MTIAHQSGAKVRNRHSLPALDLHHVVAAHGAFIEAKRDGSAEEISRAKRLLQNAVDDVRDAGGSWGQIADAIGTRRGNAYSQFRQRGAR